MDLLRAFLLKALSDGAQSPQNRELFLADFLVLAFLQSESGFRKKDSASESPMEESEKPNRYESMMIRITEKDFARPVTDTRDR